MIKWRQSKVRRLFVVYDHLFENAFAVECFRFLRRHHLQQTHFAQVQPAANHAIGQVNIDRCKSKVNQPINRPVEWSAIQSFRNQLFAVPRRTGWHPITKYFWKRSIERVIIIQFYGNIKMLRFFGKFYQKFGTSRLWYDEDFEKTTKAQPVFCFWILFKNNSHKQQISNSKMNQDWTGVLRKKLNFGLKIGHHTNWTKKHHRNDALNENSKYSTQIVSWIHRIFF